MHRDREMAKTVTTGVLGEKVLKLQDFILTPLLGSHLPPHLLVQTLAACV